MELPELSTLQSVLDEKRTEPKQHAGNLFLAYLV